MRFHKLIDRVTSFANGPVRWFWSIEPTMAGRDHLHALLWETSPSAVSAVGAAWTWGFSNVQVYDARGSACHYVTKTLRPDSYNFSSKMPPRLLPSGPLADVAGGGNEAD